jgi:hypothetical protein
VAEPGEADATDVTEDTTNPAVDLIVATLDEDGDEDEEETESDTSGAIEYAFARDGYGSIELNHEFLKYGFLAEYDAGKINCGKID